MRQQEFYHRSIAADPKLSWPWLALGAHAGARAEWIESSRCFRKALELGIDPATVTEPLHVARIASGEASVMVDEYRKSILAKPDDPELLFFLCDALAVSGEGDKIDQEIQKWLSHVPEPALSQIAGLTRALGRYIAGDLEHAAESARSAQARGGNSMLAQCLLALGRSEEVIKDKSLDTLGNDPWLALAVSLGLTVDGRNEDANTWREKAAETLSSLTEDERVTAKALRATEPPPVGDLEQLTIDPSFKALTFAVLARRFPDHADEYNAEAAKYNIRHKHPYQLIRRAIAGPHPKAEP
jgi:tetratricopeptide (TPR) repeat protein